MACAGGVGYDAPLWCRLAFPRAPSSTPSSGWPSSTCPSAPPRAPRPAPLPTLCMHPPPAPFRSPHMPPSQLLRPGPIGPLPQVTGAFKLLLEDQNHKEAITLRVSPRAFRATWPHALPHTPCLTGSPLEAPCPHARARARAGTCSCASLVPQAHIAEVLPRHPMLHPMLHPVLGPRRPRHPQSWPRGASSSLT